MSRFSAIKSRAEAIMQDVLSDQGLAVMATYRRFSGLNRDESIKSSVPQYREIREVPFIRDLSISHVTRVAAEAAGVELQEYRGTYTTLLKYVSDEEDGSDLGLNDLIIDGGYGLRVRHVRAVVGTVVKFVCSVDAE